MDTQAASENLQLIRTLMERAALYRRALAPVMIATGAIGLAGAVVGIIAQIENLHAFVQLWLGTGVVGIGATLLIARRQSLQAREMFFTPPARRVIAALIPALFIGGALGVGLLELSNDEARNFLMVPALWIALYGCALHAAGWFTTRGLRWFGLANLLPACAALPFVMRPVGDFPWQTPHLVMGVWFGVFHLLFGAWLYFTERKETGA
jgi:hypothetical protein